MRKTSFCIFRSFSFILAEEDSQLSVIGGQRAAVAISRHISWAAYALAAYPSLLQVEEWDSVPECLVSTALREGLVLHERKG
jgi:hypothetical protein